MRLATPVLWVGAAGVALVYLARARRGKPVVIRGRWTPRFVRMVAVMIVLAGGWFAPRVPAQEDGAPGSERPEGDALVPLGGEFPRGFHAHAETWAWWTQTESAWTAFKQDLAARKFDFQARSHAEDLGPLAPFFTAEIDRLAGAPGAPPLALSDLAGALDTAEGIGLFDSWFVAWIWRRSREFAGTAAVAEPRALASLYSRLETHARVSNALAEALARTGAVVFQAWRSKAAPPPGRAVEPVFPRDFLSTATSIYATIDAGSWEDEGTIALSVSSAAGPLVLLRRGAEVEIGAGRSFVLRRLDVVLAPVPGEATLAHERLGELRLPARAALTATNAGEFLAPEARSRVAAWVESALGGDAEATRHLEEVLPAAHAFVRGALEESAGRPGAATLRLVLENFDD
ncbi:MAG: hypothetical protein HY720_03260 [Planctomycetes bacterium]|nr:hypothetical protein [Planctomycetota bacterium]